MSERDELKPCPFCGGKADFERMGTSRQSCIVECESCGVRHESSDEYGRSGQSWNERQPTRSPQAVPALTDAQIFAVALAAGGGVHTHWGEWKINGADLIAFARAILAAPQQAVPALTDAQIDWEHLYNEMAKRYADACSEIARLDLLIKGLETTDDRIENAAIALWHRFAPDHHMEWEAEVHKAEYRDAASAILAAPQPSLEPEKVQRYQD